MCAIIGLAAEEHVRIEDIISFLTKIFNESKIRGLHATGISWSKRYSVATEKDAVPADQFALRFPSLELEGHLFIGHCRYSTSDLEFNQPIADETLSIVHNGVVTQEDPSKWPSDFGGEFLSRNDTEIIYHCLKKSQNPLEKLPQASMAVLSLQPGKMLAFRNGKRPLWFGKIEGLGTIISSTKDILLRSGVTDPWSSEAGTVYRILASGPVPMNKVMMEDWQ
jgi:glutamine phosphoribosylpyrophosphate amidotransferase